MSPPNKPKPKNAAKKNAREELLANAREKDVPPDPLSPANLKSLAMRLGIPFAVVWAVAIFLRGWYWKAGAGVLTLGVAGLLLWALLQAKRSRKVADIVRGADSPEARKEALSKLETDFKKDDHAAIFAKAQLQMQEDPRAALATLEQVNLQKAMAPVADEARAQRGMIHLMLGETDEARSLVEGIDLARHKEPKVRATLSAIMAEAYARTGQAKKAVEMLETLDPDDVAFKDVLPQLLRSRAFAYAWANNTKQMKSTLRRLQALNVQYLTGFITKKKIPGGVPPRGVHPLLEKEAFEMIQKSGAMPRRMEYRRG